MLMTRFGYQTSKTCSTIRPSTYPGTGHSVTMTTVITQRVSWNTRAQITTGTNRYEYTSANLHKNSTNNPNDLNNPSSYANPKTRVAQIT